LESGFACAKRSDPANANEAKGIPATANFPKSLRVNLLIMHNSPSGAPCQRAFYVKNIGPPERVFKRGGT
jgi:hypothetical protein